MLVGVGHFKDECHYRIEALLLPVAMIWTGVEGQTIDALDEPFFIEKHVANSAVLVGGVSAPGLPACVGAEIQCYIHS